MDSILYRCDYLNGNLFRMKFFVYWYQKRGSRAPKSLHLKIYSSLTQHFFCLIIFTLCFRSKLDDKYPFLDNLQFSTNIYLSKRPLFKYLFYDIMIVSSLNENLVLRIFVIERVNLFIRKVYLHDKIDVLYNLAFWVICKKVLKFLVLHVQALSFFSYS